jgi:hypothetical protein
MIVLFVLLLAALPLAAQEGVPAAGAPAAPAEPDIVLPEVILQIADLSVETVEAGLPTQEELLPPPAERAVPLPEQVDLPLAEPDLRPQPGQAEPAAVGEDGGELFADLLLGAGNMNHLLSSVTLTRAGAPGGRPRFSFAFRHEMLDGFGEHDPGSGFHSREDALEGLLKLPLGSSDFEARGSFSDRERGLQDLDPDVLAVGARQGASSLRLSLPAGRRITLETGLEARFAARLLSGTGPEQRTETLLRPEVAAVYRRGIFWAGLSARAGRRVLEDDPDGELIRFAADLSAGFELESGARLEARGGWFASREAGSVFPFDLSLTLPAAAFTLRAAGGYRVTEIDCADLLSAYVPVAFPAGGPQDDRGWFGEAGCSLRLSPGLSVLAQGEVATHRALPDLEADSLTADGLFVFSQVEALTVRSRLGVRWNPLPPLAVSAGWTGELADFSRFAPLGELPGRQLVSVEAEATERAGRWNARALLRFDLDRAVLPELGLGGYYRLGENIAVGLEGEDLLAAFAAEPRSWLSPWEEPGARGLLTLRINF